MLSIVIKFGFGAVIVTAGLGMCIALLSRQMRLDYEASRNTRQHTLEYFLLLSLKGFTIAYLISMLAVAVFPSMLLLLSWPVIQSLPGELPYAVTIGLALMGIGGLVAMPTAFLKKPRPSRRYLPVDMVSEPGMYGLIAELASQFDMPMLTDIRLTPGADLRIREQAETFDQVFAGGGKIVEIGLAGLEMLNAGDLKILLARELFHFADNTNLSMAFIRRLASRFDILTENFSNSGFLMMLNPVAWMAFLAKPAIYLITEEYLVMNEFRADNQVLITSGSNRLAHALARYNVETELYRDLLNIIARSDKTGIGYVGNVYNSMRRAQVESTSELVVMINHLFKDTALTRGDAGKKSLRLRLRRLPEMPASALEINRPALVYLTDWRQTENRMIKVLGA